MTNRTSRPDDPSAPHTGVEPVGERLARLSGENLTFGVIGLGYAGLPLAVEAAATGLAVLGFDVQPSVVDQVNAGRSHIQDLSDERVGSVTATGALVATTDMSRLAECDVISICVPTPLSKTRDPDVSYILSATRAVARTLRSGQLIVLESTTYPGTTREVVLPALAGTNLTVGHDFCLCFSPERVDPGNAVWNTRNTPKVIGGITPTCGDVGRRFYERFVDTVVLVSSTEAAELTKLLENTFRAVNIALVNETALIADILGVDVFEVIEAAATKPFGYMKFTPGPGLGGHCIPVDPHYLSWKMRSLNYRARLIELAAEINAEMPIFVAGKVREALNGQKKSVNGADVLVLGIAYKRDVGDIRESPALDVIRLLEAEGARVQYHDPLVPRVTEGGRDMQSIPLTEAALAGADVVVVITDHSVFDYAWILDKARVLVDARNATAAVLGEAARADGTWIVKAGPTH